MGCTQRHCKSLNCCLNIGKKNLHTHTPFFPHFPGGLFVCSSVLTQSGGAHVADTGPPVLTSHTMPSSHWSLKPSCWYWWACPGAAAFGGIMSGLASQTETHLPWSILIQNTLSFYMIVLAIPWLPTVSHGTQPRSYENVGVTHPSISFLASCKFSLSFSLTQFPGACIGRGRHFSSQCLCAEFVLILADFECELLVFLLMPF